MKLRLKFERWRHGGWYTNANHSGGGCGCVSNNYPDGKWRIVADEDAGTFASRTEAAYAEMVLTLEERLSLIAKRCDEAGMSFDGTEAAAKFYEIRDFALEGCRATESQEMSLARVARALAFVGQKPD